MRSNAGVAKQTEGCRLARSVSLRPLLDLWLVGWLIGWSVGWFGLWLVWWLVVWLVGLLFGWFSVFSWDCYTPENET